MERWLRGVVLGLAMLAAPTRAWAGDPAAEALFLQGRAAADKGDFATACARFHESNRLEPAVGTIFNLGDCEEKLGRVATAWTFFREVVQRLPPGDERAPIAKKRADALEPRLPRLTLRLAAGAPAGVRVTRGGVEVGAASFGIALPVDPGSHAVEVTAAGRRPASLKIDIKEGEQREAELQIGEALPVEGGGPAGPVEAPRSSRRTMGYVFGGVGVAGLAVGGVAGLLTLGKKSTVDDNCSADKRCNRTGYDAVSAGKTLGTVSVVGFVLGAIGAGAGAYFLLSDGSPNQTRTALVPTVGPGDFRLGLVRSW